MRHRGESGSVKGRDGIVTWRMTADEAEEIADYLERSSVPHDAVRVDVAAIQSAIKDARFFEDQADDLAAAEATRGKWGAG
jgi:hypothetical protein